MSEQKHIISVLVENRFGVLARISGLFSGRGFNIDSLTVAETDEPAISRMTIVSTGDEQILEQINKQLNKLIDVIKVSDFTGEEYVERELALIKVKAEGKVRSEIVSLVNIFRARTVDVSSDMMTIEITGDADKLMAFVDMLRPYGIQELVRTGKVAILRGNREDF